MQRDDIAARQERVDRRDRRRAGSADRRIAQAGIISRDGGAKGAREEIAHAAADLLMRRYEEQVYRLRKSRQPKLDSALGCRLGAVPPRGIDDAFRLSFNTAVVPLTWRTIEPAESIKLIALPAGLGRGPA